MTLDEMNETIFIIGKKILSFVRVSMLRFNYFFANHIESLVKIIFVPIFDMSVREEFTAIGLDTRVVKIHNYTLPS